MSASNVTVTPVTPATKPVKTKPTAKAKPTVKTKPTAKAKPTVKTKPTAKPARKTLTRDQRSEISRLAAYKAWAHNTFQPILANAAKAADETLAAHKKSVRLARPKQYRSIAL